MIGPVSHNCQRHCVVMALTRRHKCVLSLLCHRLMPQQSQLSISLSSFLFPYSLAVHPDKITIATGQVAGTSSDGKVRLVIQLRYFKPVLFVTISSLICHDKGAWSQSQSHMLQIEVELVCLCLAAVGSSRASVGLCEFEHVAHPWNRFLWPSSGLPLLLQVGKRQPLYVTK